MSVQSAAAHARTARVGRAEQMVRTATSTLSAFPMVQRVGAAAAALDVAEQLLVGALTELRAVRQELAVVTDGPNEDPAGAEPAPARPGVPAEIATLAAAGRVVTPLTVRSGARWVDIIR